MIERFSEAVETGKWPDGNHLSEKQRESCIQAIMLYKARYSEQQDEPFTISKDGELMTAKKLRSDFQGVSSNDKESLKNQIDIHTDTSSKND